MGAFASAQPFRHLLEVAGTGIHGLAYGMNAGSLQKAIRVTALAQFTRLVELEKGIQPGKSRRTGEWHAHGDVGLFQSLGQGL